MDKFRVALSPTSCSPTASRPSLPSISRRWTPTRAIEWGYVPVRDGRIAAADMAGVDALILLAGRFDAESLPGTAGSPSSPASASATTTSTSPACTRRRVALVITPDGVRRPVAVAMMTFDAGALRQAARQGPADRGPAAGLGQARGAHGLGPGRPHPRLGRHRQHRRRAVPPGGAVRHELHRARSRSPTGGRGASSASSWSRSTSCSGGPTSSRVNCPLTAETRHLVNAERLALMKPTAYLINTARGPIVDQAALTAGAAGAAGSPAPASTCFEQEPSDAGRSDPRARQRHPHAARALLDRPVLRRQRRRRRPGRAGGDRRARSGGHRQPGHHRQRALAGEARGLSTLGLISYHAEPRDRRDLQPGLAPAGLSAAARVRGGAEVAVLLAAAVKR